MARLLDQIREAVAALRGGPTAPALIGGLALAAHQVVRATQDVDFLVDAGDADRFHEVILGLGYTCIHRSGDVANYVRGDEGLDLLYAYRPVARKLLEQAEVRETTMGPLRVISVEGLIAFKLQAHVNDPSRGRDIDDIRALLRANAESADLDELRQYFRIFDQEDLLDDLLAEAGRG